MKRIFDFVGAAIGLLLFAPVILVISYKVRREMGFPILFTQERPGFLGKPFKLYKFRSMTDKRNADGKMLSDSERLTKFGQFLRSTSMDELPELWNVLRGEMSLVGPRPLLIEYLPLYTQEQARRHKVRPGITGWAQINGRNAITWDEKFALDTWYVDNRSFLLDMKILLITVKRVIFREGINQEGNATIEKFTGTNRSDRRP